MSLKMNNFYFSLVYIFLIFLEISLSIACAAALQVDENISVGSTVKYKRAKIKGLSPNSNQPTIVRNADGKLEYVYPVTTTQPLADSTTGREEEVRDIIFPTEEPLRPTTPQSRFGNTAPCDTSLGQTFCVQSDSFSGIPLNDPYIQEKLAKFEYLFGNDYIEPEVIVQRLDAPGEESLCSSSERVIYPTSGMNMNNQWIQIVNVKNYTQGFRVEVCSYPEKKCDMTDSFPYNYETRCVQKYTYRTVVAVREDKTPYKERVKLPSCCKCIVRTLSADRTHDRSPSPSRSANGNKRELNVESVISSRMSSNSNREQSESMRNERLIMS